MPPPAAPCSALGAEADAPSRRLRTKAAGDEVVRSELGPISTIFKPAAVSGTEDRLFNMFATMAKRTPFLPLIDGGKTRMQPVWVRDVAAGGDGAARGLGCGGGAAGMALCRALRGPRLHPPLRQEGAPPHSPACLPARCPQPS